MLSQTASLLFQCVPIQGRFFPQDMCSNLSPGLGSPPIASSLHCVCCLHPFPSRLRHCVYMSSLPRESVSSTRNRTVGSDSEVNLSLQGHMGPVILVRVSPEMLTVLTRLDAVTSLQETPLGLIRK